MYIGLIPTEEACPTGSTSCTVTGTIDYMITADSVIEENILPVTTFSLSSTSVTVGTNVTISNNCTTTPTSYTSSNTAVATIAGNTITTITAGTTNITPVGGNCSDITVKTLTVTTPPAPICPTGFIHIPGSENIDSQTKGWCVAKYEMVPYNTTGWTQDTTYKGWICKTTSTSDTTLYNCSGQVTSKSGIEPITYISRNEAQNACATNLVDQSGNTIGSGKLLTVQLWSKIARDIEQQNINWTGNTPGSGNMSRGHANNGPATTLKAGDNTGWTAIQSKANGNYYFTREWTLSNGSTINDFAGNVWEWFYDKHNGNNAGGCWATENTAYSIGGYSLTPSNITWSNTTYGVGRQCYPGNTLNSDGGSFASFFGGNWHHTTDAGVFTSYFFSYSPSTTRILSIGFRCIAPAQ